MGQVFKKGLEKGEKKEGLLKRLKNIEGKTDKHLDLIRGQENKQLDLIKENKNKQQDFDGKTKSTNKKIVSLIKETKFKETEEYEKKILFPVYQQTKLIALMNTKT